MIYCNKIEIGCSTGIDINKGGFHMKKAYREELERVKRSKTERQWLDEGYAIIPGTGFYHTGPFGKAYEYFEPENVKPLTEQQRKAYRKKRYQDRKNIADQANKEKEQDEKRQLQLLANPQKTSFQWLRCHRIIKEGAKPANSCRCHIPLDDGDWMEITYYYYSESDTEDINEDEYERLKALYIEKYGGFDHIPANNIYNGKPWY